MVKEPVAGRVKTRLGQDVGMTSAAWWYRHQALATIRRLRDPRWRLVLGVTPDRAGLSSRVWPVDIARLPQGTGDLGQRMSRLLSLTSGPTLLIGSDIPGVRPRHIAAGFRALGQASSVVGPAQDGGFWLIGLRYPSRQPSRFLRNVRWSEADTLANTLPTLPGPVARIEALSDVDSALDLSKTP
jgi:glycosyltransferase A (GT-A) superfamily protein (DUF2064 family)